MNMQTTNEPKKRTVTRIGDIFCAEIDYKYKVFLQYIAKDFALLGSRVIRVFKTRYPMDYVPIMDEIVKDQVDFCAHVFANVGVHAGLWHKIGKSKDWGDPASITFIKSRDQGNRDPDFISKKWSIRKIGEELVYVGELPEEYHINTYYDVVYPPFDIINRIKNGKHTFTTPRYK